MHASSVTHLIHVCTTTAAFYIGGGFVVDEINPNKVSYQAGRGLARDQCTKMKSPGSCKGRDFGWTRITNSKVFLLSQNGFVRKFLQILKRRAFVHPSSLLRLLL